MKRADK